MHQAENAGTTASQTDDAEAAGTVQNRENKDSDNDPQDFTASWVYNEDGLLMVSDDRNRDLTVAAVKRLLGNYPVEECHLAGFVNGSIVSNRDMQEAQNYGRILLNGGLKIPDFFTEEECIKLRQIGIF